MGIAGPPVVRELIRKILEENLIDPDTRVKYRTAYDILEANVAACLDELQDLIED